MKPVIVDTPNGPFTITFEPRCSKCGELLPDELRYADYCEKHMPRRRKGKK